MSAAWPPGTENRIRWCLYGKSCTLPCVDLMNQPNPAVFVEWRRYDTRNDDPYDRNHGDRVCLMAGTMTDLRDMFKVHFSRTDFTEGTSFAVTILNVTFEDTMHLVYVCNGYFDVPHVNPLGQPLAIQLLCKYIERLNQTTKSRHGTLASCHDRARHCLFQHSRRDWRRRRT